MALRQVRTVNELKAEARAKAIVGYSKMRKAELEEALLHPELHRVRKTPARLAATGPTVKALREQAKLAGLKGYYKKNKAELLAELGRAGVAQATARMAFSLPIIMPKQGLPISLMTENEMRGYAKSLGIPNYEDIDFGELWDELERKGKYGPGVTYDQYNSLEYKRSWAGK